MNIPYETYLFDRTRKKLLKNDYVLFWKNLTPKDLLEGSGDFKIGKILTYNVFDRTMTILNVFNEDIIYNVHELNVVKI